MYTAKELQYLFICSVRNLRNVYMQIDSKSIRPRKMKYSWIGSN